jgi:hypothetical protein
MGAYDQVGHQLLGSTCSAPIRVLANNDVPSGAAFISMHLPIRADWEGWLPHNMKVLPRSASLPTSVVSGVSRSASVKLDLHWQSPYQELGICYETIAPSNIDPRTCI